MTFPLIGESYGALAAQQQNYDQLYNSINAANRAAFTQAADREADMAFRAREMANRDALNAAQQQESRFRFGVERALQERSRADQLAAQQARMQEQKFQFGEQVKSDKARLELDKARYLAAGEDESDDEAMLKSEQLGRAVESLEQAAANRAAAEARVNDIAANAARAGLELLPGAPKFTFKVPTVGSAVKPETFDNAIKEARKAAVEAARNEARLKAGFERDLTNLETRGLSGGWKVDRAGNRIVTSKGAYSFGPAAAPTTASQAAGEVEFVQGADGVLRRRDGTPVIPQRSAQQVRSDIGDYTPPDDRQEFSEPPRPSSARVRFDIPEVTPKPPQEYTGLLPASARLALKGVRNAVNAPIAYARGVSRAMGVVPAAARNVWRGARDLAIMPPEGSPEYDELMRERAAYDANVREFAFPPPSYF